MGNLGTAARNGQFYLAAQKNGSSGFCVEGRRIGIIWVHLNLDDILGARDAPLPLAQSYYCRGELHSPSLNNFCCSPIGVEESRKIIISQQNHIICHFS
jgi:hypothetical protein